MFITFLCCNVTITINLNIIVGVAAGFQFVEDEFAKIKDEV
jgi:hypothetical protein